MKSPYRYPPSWAGGFVLGESPLGAANDFPVAAGVQKTILSYLYEQWQLGTGSDDLQAFVDAFNRITQYYVDWFCNAALPCYTQQNGDMLNWVALGVYGFARPLLPIGTAKVKGPINTYRVGGGEVPIDGWKVIEPATFYNTSDDIFQRILTWFLYTGDGKQINARWLKRRVARFLTGTGGIGGYPIPSDIQMALDSFGSPVFWPTFYNIDMTGQISVQFAGTEGTIRIVTIQRQLTGGSLPNRFRPNGQNSLINSDTSVTQSFQLPAFAAIFKAAVDDGILELPGPWTWRVQLQ